ncbi:hypothetical protein HNY73_021302 [Argiope bruennichi]|uniref:Uncharacterized protein n=1 Tax=Argiope bruennichi TaxID=94029 RepID=A0A8T0E9G7_ARGBR|nr:hypothetical protein HNY73_021302 [Argiope bruennichi]
MTFSKFICSPQKIIHSTKDSFMNGRVALQYRVCHGCRKLFSYDPLTKEPLAEDFAKIETTTLLRDSAEVDDDIIRGTPAISNVTSAKALPSTRVWSNAGAESSEMLPSPQSPTTIYQERDLDFRWGDEGISHVTGTSKEEFLNHDSSEEHDAWDDKEIKRTHFRIPSNPWRSDDSRSTISTSHASVIEEVLFTERNGENLEENRKSNSERFGLAGGLNSMSGMFTEVLKDFERMTSRGYSFLDIQQMEAPSNKRNEEEQEEIRTSNSEKFGDTGSTNVVTRSLPQEGEMKGESQFAETYKRISPDPKNFEVSDSETSRHTKQADAPLKVKSFPYTEAPGVSHESLSSISARELLQTQMNQAEWQTSPIINVDRKGVQSLLYIQPIQIRRGSSETMNEATMANEPTENNYQVLGMTTESLLVPSQTNDKLQENKEMRNSKNVIWSVARNRKYFDFPETMQQIIEGPKNLRSLNDEWEKKNGKSNFPTIHRSIKSSQVNFEFSETPNSTTKSPVITSVNDVVLLSTTNRLKSNRTLNLLHSTLAEACEKGSGSCMKCREISPYMATNPFGSHCQSLSCPVCWCSSSWPAPFTSVSCRRTRSRTWKSMTCGTLCTSSGRNGACRSTSGTQSEEEESLSCKSVLTQVRKEFSSRKFDEWTQIRLEFPLPPTWYQPTDEVFRVSCTPLSFV